MFNYVVSVYMLIALCHCFCAALQGMIMSDQQASDGHLTDQAESHLYGKGICKANLISK